jgi:hypothetical protein
MNFFNWFLFLSLAYANLELNCFPIDKFLINPNCILRIIGSLATKKTPYTWNYNWNRIHNNPNVFIKGYFSKEIKALAANPNINNLVEYEVKIPNSERTYISSHYDPKTCCWIHCKACVKSYCNILPFAKQRV